MIRVIFRSIAAFLVLVVLHFVYSIVFGVFLNVYTAVGQGMEQAGVPATWFADNKVLLDMIFGSWKFYVPAAALAILVSIIVEATRRRPEEVVA